MNLLTTIALWHVVMLLIPITCAVVVHLKRKLNYRRALRHSARLDEAIRRHEDAQRYR